jgi:hypothetical protein
MHLRAALATAELLHAGQRLVNAHYRAPAPNVLEGLAAPPSVLTRISARCARRLAITRSYLSGASSSRSCIECQGTDRIVDEPGTAKYGAAEHALTAADTRPARYRGHCPAIDVNAFRQIFDCDDGHVAKDSGLRRFDQPSTKGGYEAVFPGVRDRPFGLTVRYCQAWKARAAHPRDQTRVPCMRGSNASSTSPSSRGQRCRGVDGSQAAITPAGERCSAIR